MASSPSSCLGHLPVITVNSQTISSTWSVLEEAITKADYIALDLELSGLGDRKRLNFTSIEDRYQNLCQIASTHSVISLGVACFQWVWPDYTSPTTNTLHLKHHVFDIILFCSEPYLIEQQSIKFLVSHGFNFNTQYQYGLSYKPSSKMTAKDGEDSLLSKLLLRLIQSQKPIIFHNGFIDLVFLYSNFYAPLPKTLNSFVADLTEMFVGGVYDTKNMAESIMTESATYLEYIFHKNIQYNETLACVKKHNLKLLPTDVLSIYSSAVDCVSFLSYESYKVESLPPVCECYAEWGYCPKLTTGTCTKSHNIYHVLAAEEAGSFVTKTTKKKKRKRKRQSKESSSAKLEELFHEELSNAKRRLTENNEIDTETKESANSEIITEELTKSDNQDVPQLGAQVSGDKEVLSSGHRAGTDAFATGYCFSSFVLRLLSPDSDLTRETVMKCLEDHYNKIALGSKPMPLLIAKSQYSNTSVYHRQIMDRFKV